MMITIPRYDDSASDPLYKLAQSTRRKLAYVNGALAKAALQHLSEKKGPAQPSRASEAPLEHSTAGTGTLSTAPTPRRAKRWRRPVRRAASAVRFGIPR